MQIFTGALQKHMPAVSLFCIATLSNWGINKTAMHWCQGCLHRCVECKPPQVQLQRHMPAFSLFCTAPLRIRASAKLQCTGVRVTCIGVQDTNLHRCPAEAHACCQPVLHSNPEQWGINKTAVHWCQGCLHRCVECKPPRVQLQRHMPAFSLFCTAPLRIRASAKLQCTGVRVTCIGVQDTNLHRCLQKHMPAVSLFCIATLSMGHKQNCSALVSLHRCVECKPSTGATADAHACFQPVLHSTPEN